MSLIHEAKVNKLYKSTSMVEARAPAKEISAVGKIRQKHNEELRQLGQRQDKEWDQLKKDHQKIINKNIELYRKDTLAPDQQEAKEKDIAAMRKRHQRQDADARTRHRLELEHHYKRHGTEG
jgi:hypothetical protein